MNTKLLTVFNIVPKNACQVWCDSNEVANLLGQEGMVRLMQANVLNMADDKYDAMLIDIASNIVAANQLDKYLRTALDEKTIKSLVDKGNYVTSTSLSTITAPGFDINKRIEKTNVEITHNYGGDDDEYKEQVEIALDGLAVELVTNQLSAIVDKYFEQLDDESKHALGTLIDLDKADVRFNLDTGRLTIFVKHEGFGLPKVEAGELTEELEEEEDDGYDEDAVNDDDDE